MPYNLSRKLWLVIKRGYGLIDPESFTHHQLLLLLVIITSLAVMADNLMTKQTEADTLGRNSLIFPLIEQDTEFVISEGSDYPNGSATDNLAPDQEPTTATTSEINIIPIVNGGAILKPHLVTTQPGIGGRDRIEKYVVRAGDTLLGIAERFGLKLTTILWENRLTERSPIRIGQTLTILPTDGVSYRIGRGDTAAKLASRFRAVANDIVAFNHLENGLVVGQTIVIPGGRPPATVAVTPPKPSLNIPVVQITPPKPAANSGRLLWPTTSRRLSQYYSWRHTGLDLPNSKGTPIYAAEDGIVEAAGWNRGGYGYYVIVDHGGGIKTLYAHNSKLKVAVGDRVTRGQLIADMGSTGRSTGSHLHFEVRVNGRRVNPLLYIK
jgi:murein DD-endopeptidase MepM/ murein hydrolase activator NlpD